MSLLFKWLLEKGRWTMNANKTVFGTFAVAVLAILFLGSLAVPAIARDRRSSDRHERSSRSRNRDRRNSGLSIGLGYSNRIYSTSYRRWVPGYYQTHTEQVLVEPGHYDWQTHQVQVEPERYEVRNIPAVEKTVRDEQGQEHTIILQPARTETVYIPPKYEQRPIKLWVPDRYETRHIQVWIPGYWVSQPSYSYSPGRFSLNLGGFFRF